MDVERECTQLGTLFHSIVTDLKSSSPAWDDFVNKGAKLHNLLKSTTIAMSGFVESIQRIADMATNTKGSTKDVGSALTRICVRQKMMENKLKHFTNALLEKLIGPVQERLEEWKKVASQLEKDHAKDYKKAMHEIKKRNTDTLRLQKKVRKGSKPDLQHQLNSAMHDVNERFTNLEEIERSALRNLLVEERSRICFFANCLSPVLDLQVSMLNEVSHIQDLTGDVAKLCRNPKQLPTSTDQLVQDFISVNTLPTSPLQDMEPNGFLSCSHSPPPSPTPDGSRKSSLCSLNSLASSDSRSSGSLNRNSSFHLRHYQGFHRRTNSGSNTGQAIPTPCTGAPLGPAVVRLSSVSSHDSGFVSTGNGAIPLGGADHGYKQQMSLPCGKTEPCDDVSDGVPPIIRSRSNSEQAAEPLTPSSMQGKAFWKDWNKPGPYDPPAPPSTVSDSRRNVLPSKPTPPPLSPKPAYFSSHHSVEETKTSRPVPPLLHANTTPCFFSSLPPKDDNSLPPPPPPDKDKFQSHGAVEDPLPPPPSTLLNGGDAALSNNTLQSSAPESFHPHHELPADDASHPDCAQTSQVPQYTPPPQEFNSMTLGRKNSNNSLQFSSSSGYSSQNTTPACSEDTIASHETDNSSVDHEEQQQLQQHRPGGEGEKYSTLPRNYHHGNGHHARKSQSQRPASTAGIPATNAVGSEIDSGTATIRRKPSSKYNSVKRRANGPKAVQTPTIPNTTVATLMSTFTPPSLNTNDNNLHGRSSGFPRFYESNPTQEKQSLSRDLSLQLQQTNGIRSNSLTSAMAPTMSDSQPCYGNKLYIDSNGTSHSSAKN